MLYLILSNERLIVKVKGSVKSIKYGKLSTLCVEVCNNQLFVLLISGEEPVGSFLLLCCIFTVLYVGQCIDIDHRDIINRVLNPPVKMYIHPTAFTDPEAYKNEFHKKDIRPGGNDISKLFQEFLSFVGLLPKKSQFMYVDFGGMIKPFILPFILPFNQSDI